MDVSNEPECLNDRFQTNKVLKAQANKAARDIGIDSDANDLVKLSDDDLMKLINSKLKRFIKRDLVLLKSMILIKEVIRNE